MVNEATDLFFPLTPSLPSTSRLSSGEGWNPPATFPGTLYSTPMYCLKTLSIYSAVKNHWPTKQMRLSPCVQLPVFFVGFLSSALDHHQDAACKAGVIMRRNCSFLPVSQKLKLEVWSQATQSETRTICFAAWISPPTLGPNLKQMAMVQALERRMRLQQSVIML